MTDPRVKAVARTLCKAFGLDPDTTEAPTAFMEKHFRRAGAASHVSCGDLFAHEGRSPLWQEVAGGAKLILKAADAAACRPIEEAPTDGRPFIGLATDGGVYRVWIGPSPTSGRQACISYGGPFVEGYITHFLPWPTQLEKGS